MPSSIIFCGTPDFAVPSLEALIADPAFRVDLVITQPDRPVGKKRIFTAPPVKECAEKHGIPVFQPSNVNKELMSWFALRQAQGDTTHHDTPHFLVVVAYGAILSEEVLKMPSIAPVNVHASLLPRWRGASPIEHALLAGDAETGVTVQIMAKELDAGPVLAQARLPITAEDTRLTLRSKLAALGGALLVQTLKAPLVPVTQPTIGITTCKKLTKADGIADPATMTAEEIGRRVRALNPWPGVTMNLHGTSLKILEAWPAPAKGCSHHSSAAPVPGCGPDEQTYPLPCKGNTTLHLLSVQPASGKPMTAAAWARGRR